MALSSIAYLVVILVMMVAPSTGNLPLNLGVCYGTLADNLLPSRNVIAMYNNYRIPKMRILNPDPEMLQAVRGTGIAVSVGVSNQDLATIAASQLAANSWVNTNIVPYQQLLLEYVTVGNSAVPGENAQHVAPAMKNILNALQSVGLNSVIVTTAVATDALGTSFPPSQGAFSDEAADDMRAIISFLSENGQVIMVNVYPYFAYAADPYRISLSYAQFFNQDPEFQDGDLSYYNLFDAMVDAFYAAMEKMGGNPIGITIGETGWPSAGNGNLTTPDLAKRYISNFVQHISSATPRRPDYKMEGYIYAMFNENQKPAGVGQNFGLFYTNGFPVYQLPQPNL